MHPISRPTAATVTAVRIMVRCLLLFSAPLVASLHKFPGDATDPPYTKAAAELKSNYKKLLEVVPMNKKPGANFEAATGSFNFQEPEGVLSLVAKADGKALLLEECTVVDIGGGGHTPPALAPFIGVSRMLSIDASKRNMLANKGLHRAGKRKSEQITQIATPENIPPLLKLNNVPLEFEFLKIDIDSIDCDILNATLSAGFKPTVILIETNPAFPPPIRFSMRWVPNVQHGVGSPSVLFGCSVSYATDIARAFGYRLLQDAVEDALFVRAEHMSLFPNVQQNVAEVYRVGNPYLYSFRRFGVGVSEEWAGLLHPRPNSHELLLRVRGNVSQELRSTERNDNFEETFHVGVTTLHNVTWSMPRRMPRPNQAAVRPSVERSPIHTPRHTTPHFTTPHRITSQL